MHYDELTPEDQEREYLRTHPAHELSLWQEWVLVVCKRRAMPPPTGLEWDAIMATWHHGKMPIASVDELAAIRASAMPESEQG